VGERVPSTREISRHWGVAIATATKVLATPRAGGTGAGGAGRRHGRRAAAGPAAAVADAEGLDALSMRRVAVELGAAPMSLYRHVRDKDDLLLRMMDAALREWRAPSDAGPDLRSRLEYAARSLWTLFRRHMWLAPALSLTRPPPVEGGIAYSE
jgi:AcrR family transcriptional regulator